MYYKCLICKQEIEFGWLPPATCGFMLCYPLATAVGYACLSTLALMLLGTMLGEWLAESLAFALFLVLSVVLFVPMLLFWAWLLWLIPSWVEYLRLRRHPCPKCGARTWSWGYQHGFGL